MLEIVKRSVLTRVSGIYVLWALAREAVETVRFTLCSPKNRFRAFYVSKTTNQDYLDPKGLGFICIF